MAKTETMSNKVIECGTDTRKLYSLVIGLVRLATHNPLPENRTNNELAKELATFFMSKTSKYATTWTTILNTNQCQTFHHNLTSLRK